jgi:hypothetical protein
MASADWDWMTLDRYINRADFSRLVIERTRWGRTEVIAHSKEYTKGGPMIWLLIAPSEDLKEMSDEALLDLVRCRYART